MTAKTNCQRSQNPKNRRWSTQIRRWEYLSDKKDRKRKIHNNESGDVNIGCKTISASELPILVGSQQPPQLPMQFQARNTHKSIFKLLLKRQTNNRLSREYLDAINDTRTQREMHRTITHVLNGENKKWQVKNQLVEDSNEKDKRCSGIDRSLNAYGLQWPVCSPRNYYLQVINSQGGINY